MYLCVSNVSKTNNTAFLRYNCTADLRLCFHFCDSTNPLLLKYEISRSYPFSETVHVGPARKPRRPVFSHRGSNVNVTGVKLDYMAEKMQIFNQFLIFFF